MAEPSPDIQAAADEAIRQFLSEHDTADPGHALSVLLNRTAVELHKLARARVNERRGQPDWGQWAGLQNTARSLLLQSSTCRDIAAKLAGLSR